MICEPIYIRHLLRRLSLALLRGAIPVARFSQTLRFTRITTSYSRDFDSTRSENKTPVCSLLLHLAKGYYSFCLTTLIWMLDNCGWRVEITCLRWKGLEVFMTGTIFHPIRSVLQYPTTIRANTFKIGTHRKAKRQKNIVSLIPPYLNRILNSKFEIVSRPDVSSTCGIRARTRSPNP